MTITNTIDSFKKRQRLIPYIIAGVAIILVVIGIIIVVTSLSGGGGIALFATDTPTPTITPSPTRTSAPTETPTITPTPTDTPTPTPSAPFDYIVQEGDTLYGIIETNNLGDNGIILILLLNPYDPIAGTGIDPQTQFIYVGQTITLPPPGMALPTPTPWPADAPRGTRISYLVLPGDSLGNIANQLNSTVEGILQANLDILVDGEASIIYPGQILIVPVNLVTPVPTRTPTATPTP
ncbi:MAG: LysM peptidoglycan-binding domain-containing protein [Chloroflexota bacterium]